MDLLADIIAARDGNARVRLCIGRVAADEKGRLTVLVQGSRVSALWADGMVVAHGDRVLIAVVSEVRDQSSAVVVCKVNDAPRAGSGAIKSASPNEPVVKIATSSGDVDAVLIGDSATAGSTVALVWQGNLPLAFPRRGMPDAGGNLDGFVPAPPEAPATGTANIVPLSSAVWDTKTGTWGGGTTNPTQGEWAGTGPFFGAWFYGKSFAALEGATVTGVRIRLGARRRVGRFTAPATIVVQPHADAYPASRPPLIEPATSIILPAGAGPAWHSLPVAVGQALVESGGGITLAGSDYTSLDGTATDAASGQLQIDWRR